MTPSELICLSGIALPPAIVPSRFIQGRGAKLRTWRDKFTALLIKLGHCEIQIRRLRVKTGHYRNPGTCRIRPLADSKQATRNAEFNGIGGFLTHISFMPGRPRHKP